MLTWRLLRLLLTRISSPLNTRLQQMERFHTAVPIMRIAIAHNVVFYVVRAFLLIAVPLVFLLFIGPLVIFVSLFSLVNASLMLPVVSSVVGAITAGSIAGVIGAEHEHKTYDLMAVIPIGRIGVHLAYCRHWVARNSGLIGAILGTAVVLGASSLLFGLGADGLFRLTAEENTVPVRVILAGVMTVDVGQTFGLAALIGMWSPAVTNSRSSAIIAAVGLFTALQLVLYLIFFLIGYSVIPLVFPQAQQFPGILFATFAPIALREAAAVVIWRSMMHLFSAAAVTLDPAANAGV